MMQMNVKPYIFVLQKENVFAKQDMLPGTNIHQRDDDRNLITFKYVAFKMMRMF
jgi:hypothetical protein